MSSNFTVCMLAHENGAEPEFKVSEVNLRPGRQLALDNEDNVLLASGFPSVTPNSGYPLSPTLQLNHDLGGATPERLTQIAHAEIERNRAISYRSYTVEQDPRVCVIAAEARQIHAFLDAYGGVLDITPLLTAGHDPDIATVSELSVGREAQGYSVEYDVRVPVDKGKCTYCGACGPVCPEECIDEHLFLDFSRCTFCKECEKECPAEAIDIYGAEHRTLQAPAIILLNDLSIELPEDRSMIYAADDIPAFFATQFACQVDEVVTWDSSICQYSGKLGYGCNLCASTCPHGALTRGRNGIGIDAVKCEECGGCVAACPTGAIQYERFADDAFTAYVDAIGIPRNSTVVLGSEKALHRLWWKQPALQPQTTFFIEHTEIRSLSLFHLLYLYTSGAGRIVLLGTEQELTSLEPLKRQAALAVSLLTSYWQAEKPVAILTVQQFIEQHEQHTDNVLPELMGSGTASLNRRQRLAEILEHLAGQSGQQARIKASETLPFAAISCDENLCTHCYACLNTCRIQALRTDENQFALLSQPVLCVGCGSCVRVCPENALKMTRGAILDEQFFARRSVAEAEPMHCKKCDKVFGSRKSFERVMTILANKESVNTEHFEYCETCRVEKLFDNE